MLDDLKRFLDQTFGAGGGDEADAEEAVQEGLHLLLLEIALLIASARQVGHQRRCG